MNGDGDFVHYSESDVRRLYPNLRAMAGHRMAFERAGQTLQPTALAHEVWLRMCSNDDSHWRNTAHFFAAAAETMRRILIDRARRRKCVKHAGDLERVPMIAADDEALDDEDRSTRLIVDRRTDFTFLKMACRFPPGDLVVYSRAHSSSRVRQPD